MCGASLTTSIDFFQNKIMSKKISMKHQLAQLMCWNFFVFMKWKSNTHITFDATWWHELSQQCPSTVYCNQIVAQWIAIKMNINFMFICKSVPKMFGLSFKNLNLLDHSYALTICKCWNYVCPCLCIAQFHSVNVVKS